MKPLTSEQLANLKSLHSKATKGEWHGIYGDYDGIIRPVTEYEDGLFSNTDEEYLTTLHNSFPAIIKELEAARKVAAAWNVTGPAPTLHERAKHRLKRNWPTLWVAVEKLADLNK